MPEYCNKLAFLNAYSYKEKYITNYNLDKPKNARGKRMTTYYNS